MPLRINCSTQQNRTQYSTLIKDNAGKATTLSFFNTCPTKALISKPTALNRRLNTSLSHHSLFPYHTRYGLRTFFNRTALYNEDKNEKTEQPTNFKVEEEVKEDLDTDLEEDRT